MDRSRPDRLPVGGETWKNRDIETIEKDNGEDNQKTGLIQSCG